MKRFYLSFILLFAFGNILVLHRILFLMDWIEPTSHLLFYLSIGSAYDLMVLSELAFVNILLLTRVKRYPRTLIGILVIIWNYFNFLDYIHIQMFQVHMPFSAYTYLRVSELEYMADSYISILKSPPFFLYCVLPTVLMAVLLKFMPVELPQQKKDIAANLVLLLGLAMVSGGYANSSVTDKIHPLQNNSLFYFLARSIEKTEAIQPVVVPEKELALWKQYQKDTFNKTVISKQFPWMFESLEPTPPLAQFDPLTALFTSKRPNIVLVMMESFNADRIGSYNPVSNLTPVFDKLATQGVLFEYFYANGYKTMHGEFATLCGIYPYPQTPVYRNFNHVQFNCLPELFKKQGYATSWIYAHSGQFDNQSFFHTKIGFDQIITDLDFDKHLQRLSWGYGDHELMKKAVEVLRQQPEPFFSMILTTSNHHPYDLPRDYQASQKEEPHNQTMRYSDYALSLLFQMLQKESYFDNTLFIITADTGFPLMPFPAHLKDPLQLESRRIPLLWYWKNAPAVIKVQTVGSQVDISATLFELLKWNEVHHFAGQSLLQARATSLVVESRQLDFRTHRIDNQALQQADLLEKQLPGFDTVLAKVLQYSLHNNAVWKKGNQAKDYSFNPGHLDGRPELRVRQTQRSEKRGM
ncbi:sulfatase-like hydrolase/transferase [Deltaproteobacteria bacterium TL4]